MNPNIDIDRISLRVEGIDRAAARRLGRLVAERLAPALALFPGEGAFERLEVELTALPSEDPDSIAARVAGAVALRLGRTMEAGR